MSTLRPLYLLHHQPTEAASLYPLKPIENPCGGFTLATIGDGVEWEVKWWCRGIEFMTPQQLPQPQSLQPDVLELMLAAPFKFA